MAERKPPKGGSSTAPAKHSFWRVGESYLIRTVTHYYTGRLVEITDTELILLDAAWIADTGRFGTCLTTSGTLTEIEPYPGPVLVSRAALVDATVWPFELPRGQK